jgi:hypothetical protein
MSLSGSENHGTGVMEQTPEFRVDGVLQVLLTDAGGLSNSEWTRHVPNGQWVNIPSTLTDNRHQGPLMGT